MTPCQDQELVLQALVDGELDAVNALAVEDHVKTCAACAEHLRVLRALRERLGEPELSAPAPPGLRASIEQMIARETRRPDRAIPLARRSPVAAWAGAGVAAALAASLTIAVLPLGGPTLQDQLVADHVRSLLASHLVDVATSDRHVVKPWFNGKIDFAPPAPDLAGQGFPLAGGRLDYADGRVVAALVYRRQLHVINLFVMPARGRPAPWRPFRSPTSYSVIHWSRGGLDFWAVSDVEAGQLEQFHQAFAARTSA